jgi:hypothetical protein
MFLVIKSDPPKNDMKSSEYCNICDKADDEAYDLFGYRVCEKCKTKMGLFTDETI